MASTSNNFYELPFAPARTNCSIEREASDMIIDAEFLLIANFLKNSLIGRRMGKQKFIGTPRRCAGLLIARASL